MAYWTQFRRPNTTYYDTVYNLGAAALVQARSRAGADAFDAAVREYLRRNAYSVATPRDATAALADMPEALAVLREVGALPSGGD
jgi:aminopeptidase N